MGIFAILHSVSCASVGSYLECNVLQMKTGSLVAVTKDEVNQHEGEIHMPCAEMIAEF